MDKTSLIDQLSDPAVWNAFLEDRSKRSRLSERDLKELRVFVGDQAYRRITSDMHFGLPEKKSIVKMGSSKKRIVYSYGRDETWILKLLTWLLEQYGSSFADSCYSFRRERTAKDAFVRIRTIPDLDRLYAVKADIHDYFNSMDTDILCDKLAEIMKEDPKLLSFLHELLHQDACVEHGMIVPEKRGGMAGVPVSAFFANVYLTELDKRFETKGIPYFRYSDDILFFAKTEEAAEEGFRMIEDYLAEVRLTINPDKVSVSKPGESWEFLGLKYAGGQFDLSDVTVEKMKGKIRRKARALYRWRCEKGASFQRAASAMIRSFDRQFYDLSGDSSFCWTRWFFPLITVSCGLKQIDECMVEYLRYLSSGRHYKGNYRITYEELKKLGYTPLVSEYYRWIRDCESLREADGQDQT
ncbi:MAG: reverse transcriptase/maturase family protein [Solobacterium sp.]|nr:reverse transcriptase/maturase family protein [Solobacterium sp.]